MLRKSKFALLTLVLVLALAPAAFAGLSVVSPTFNSPITSNGFPQWYTDANGISVELPVPPLGDGLTAPTMIYGPLTPASSPYAIQAGFDTEAFYFNARTDTKTFQTKFGKVLGLFGLEASYVSGTPKAGDQAVFARIRLTAPINDTAMAGTYTFFHPWGQESIPVTAADISAKKAIKFTRDIGLTPGWVSDGAGGWLPVASPLGFYSVLQPSNIMNTFLKAVAPAPPLQWLGDGVTPATFASTGGIPIVNNFVKLQGPPGVNLDGRGNNFITTDKLIISGHMPLNTLPSVSVKADRVTCSYIGTVENIDLFLTATPGSTISVVPAPGDLGTVSFPGGVVTDANGKFYASFPGTAKKISVTATLAGSNPVTITPINVLDYVNITQVAYSLGTGILSIQATSSDFIKHPTTPPVLTATATGYPTFGLAGTALTLNTITGVYSLSVPVTPGVLPPTVAVNSTVGGSDTATVAITP